MPDERGDTGRTNSAQLQALYQDLLLDHYRRPRNKGPLDDADATASLANPLCGDEVTLAVRLDPDGRIAAARFTGRGCSIAQASASMLTELVLGCDPAGIRQWRARVDALLTGDLTEPLPPELGDLRALAGVARYSARHRCATLPWEALAIALGGGGRR